MRIPTDKVYRAFPELDPFTDEQCRAYVKLAVRERWRSRVLRVVLSIPVAFAALPLTGLLSFVWSKVLIGVGAFESNEDALLAAFCLGAVSACVPCFVLVLLVRDRWLRWAIRGHLRGAACPSCGYSMLGLAVKDGHVTCPECGAAHNLKSLGRTEADILANALANASCARCRYDLTGLAPAGGLIQCPECGARQPVESLHRVGTAATEQR